MRWIIRQAAATWCGVVGHHWQAGPTLVLVMGQRVMRARATISCSRCGKAGW